jgi:hypothetical protein
MGDPCGFFWRSAEAIEHSSALKTLRSFEATLELVTSDRGNEAPRLKLFGVELINFASCKKF